MPRRIIPRKIVVPPKFKSFVPTGNNLVNGFVELLYEEYEAIKLADYDLMNHSEAGQAMGISRATLARIYERARRKIAQAFVENKEIRVVYGNAFFSDIFFKCTDCGAVFNIIEKKDEKICALCGSKNIKNH